MSFKFIVKCLVELRDKTVESSEKILAVHRKIVLRVLRHLIDIDRPPINLSTHKTHSLTVGGAGIEKQKYCDSKSAMLLSISDTRLSEKEVKQYL